MDADADEHVEVVDNMIVRRIMGWQRWKYGGMALVCTETRVKAVAFSLPEIHVGGLTRDAASQPLRHLALLDARRRAEVELVRP